MKKQVCSLELAKRLKELGVKQESFFIWTERTTPATLWRHDAWEERFQPFYKGELDCSAFTVAELGEMLPEYVVEATHQCEFRTSKQAAEFIVYYEGRKHLVGGAAFCADTEADARAKVLVYLLENGLLK